MNTPTPPYTTAPLIVLLLRQRYPQLPYTFTETTTPTLNEVLQAIDWIGAEIDMTLSTFGYYIPLQLYPGDTEWPAYQSYFLSYLCSVGVAGYTIRSQKPLATPGREGTQLDDYRTEYYKLLQRLRTGEILFRADFRHGTLAEKMLTPPSGPRNEWTAGMYDPSRYESLEGYTRRMQAVRDYMIRGWTTHEFQAGVAAYWNYAYPVTGYGPAI